MILLLIGIQTFCTQLLAQIGPPARVLPEDPVADSMFVAGLRAFEADQFDIAFQRFEDIKNRGVNRRLTMAHLMAAKTRYAGGHYEEAIALLQSFIEAYPESRYVTEAQEVLVRSQAWLAREQQLEDDLFTLGLLLPSKEPSVGFARPLLTGIRLAVIEYNQRNPKRPVRMVFRGSEAHPDSAHQAAQRLIEEDHVDAIIGPLLSEEALGAVNVAEQAGIPMLVPLATDNAVSENRRFIFQANPSWNMRGRLMARYAVQRLQIRRFGVITQAGTYAEQMAESFRDEVEILGGEVRYYDVANGTQEWYQIPEKLRQVQDTLTYLNAFYIPVTGERYQNMIRTALDGVDALSRDIRVLGNGEWHNLPQKNRLSSHKTVYSRDFYTDEAASDVNSFKAAYKALTNQDPESLAYIGYDVARLLLMQLERLDEWPTLADALREGELRQGLAARIAFRDSNVNQAIHFMEYRDGNAVVIE